MPIEVYIFGEEILCTIHGLICYSKERHVVRGKITEIFCCPAKFTLTCLKNVFMGQKVDEVESFILWGTLQCFLFDMKGHNFKSLEHCSKYVVFGIK